ncbi:signal recognition particle-docking protein FtsY [Reyranella sp.]|uniref:signal recognition particle-docking protein FtsY n=1 Tax=Reyranella sp. TaxID=1929291 RepID=UPI004036EC14
MSETEPEKKGWFARLRSRVAPTVEPPKPPEPEVEKPEPVEPAVTVESETPPALPSIEPVSEPVPMAPEPEPEPVAVTAPVEAVVEKEPEVEKPEPEKPEPEKPEVEKKGWLSRLREGLSKSTKKVAESITGLFTKKKLDQQTLDDLEDALIQADLGVAVAARLVGKLSKERFGKEVTEEEVRAAFADDIAEILQPVAVPLTIDAARKPHVVLVVGVNGSGKTTTIAKLAGRYKGEGRSVMLAAGDTFRAAAVEQLKVWGDRAGVPVVSKQTGADAAGLAYEALEQARAEKTDVLLIDTAGRLHNKTNLMEELAKIVRVIRKLDPEAPHSCLLVLDATTGQNAHAQVETFKTMSPVDALVLTKLDGSAKGGVLVALAEKFKLPVVAIGVGEGIDDLRPFEARAFARGLMGLPA